MKLTVYLGANEGNDPAFREAVRELGHWIGESGNGLVYGGSKSGLMGELARSVLEAGHRRRAAVFHRCESPVRRADPADRHPGHGGAEGKNDRAGRRLSGVPRRDRDAGRDLRGHVQGRHGAAEGALHPL